MRKIGILIALLGMSATGVLRSRKHRVSRPRKSSWAKPNPTADPPPAKEFRAKPKALEDAC
jgi:hypothetical protein